MFLSTLNQTGKPNVRPEYAEFDHSHVPPAGKPSKRSDNVSHCLTAPSDEDRNPAPAVVGKFKHPNLMDPGTIVRHPGRADDPLPAGPFGRATIQPPGQSVKDYMKVEPDSFVEQWKREQAEKTYASVRREPLGQPMQRGHKIPDGLGTERPFGRVVDAKGLDEARQVRQVLLGFPGEDPAETHQMYVRSHGDYAPGEQRKRGYDWAPGVDPETTRFGAKGTVTPSTDQVRELMRVEEPGIVSKIQADFKLTHDDEIGVPKSLGYGDRQAPDAFGQPSRRRPEWGVDKILKGEYTEDEIAPDADLGKSIRPGYRNIAPEDKTFGVPSVRTDLPQPRERSIADNRNFGSEPSTSSLLFPAPWADRGLTDEVLTRPMDREDVRGLVAASGAQVDEETFERVFSAAAFPDGRCSVGAFLNMRRAMMMPTPSARPTMAMGATGGPGSMRR